MAVSAKRALDKGIEKNEAELKRRVEEMNAEKKENNKQIERKI